MANVNPVFNQRSLAPTLCNRILVGYHHQFTATLASGIGKKLLDIVLRILMLIPAIFIYPILIAKARNAPIVQNPSLPSAPNQPPAPLPGQQPVPVVPHQPPSQPVGQQPVQNQPTVMNGQGNMPIPSAISFIQAVAQYPYTFCGPCHMIFKLNDGSKSTILQNGLVQTVQDLDKMTSFVTQHIESLPNTLRHSLEIYTYRMISEENITYSIAIIDQGGAFEHPLDPNDSRAVIFNEVPKQSLDTLAAYARSPNDLITYQITHHFETLEQELRKHIDLTKSNIILTYRFSVKNIENNQGIEGMKSVNRIHVKPKFLNFTSEAQRKIATLKESLNSSQTRLKTNTVIDMSIDAFAITKHEPNNYSIYSLSGICRQSRIQCHAIALNVEADLIEQLITSELSRRKIKKTDALLLELTT